jgi:Uma2 family endonuclease
MALLHKDEDRLITGEELFRRPELGPCELVNGKIVPMAPTGHIHGWMEAKLTGELLSYAGTMGAWEVLVGEAGVYIRRNPDTVRAADILVISAERYARCAAPSYLNVAPELAIEILSPDDRWSEVREKIADYFSAGVDRVWVFDAKQRRVFAYRSPMDVRQFDREQILSDEELFPGLLISLSRIFRD